MIGKVKEITDTAVSLEFNDGSIKLVPYHNLPNYITLDDSISINNVESSPNEKYVDYF